MVHNKCNITESHMNRQEAVNYVKEFLEDSFTKTGEGLYKFVDGLRVMHYDFSHHMYNMR